jgi:hypothetical protein
MLVGAFQVMWDTIMLTVTMTMTIASNLGGFIEEAVCIMSLNLDALI